MVGFSSEDNSTGAIKIMTDRRTHVTSKSQESFFFFGVDK